MPDAGRGAGRGARRRSTAGSPCRGFWGRPNEQRRDSARRGDAGREDRRQGGVVGRGHPGLPGPDRRDRRRSTTRSCTSRGSRRWPPRPGSTPRWPPASDLPSPLAGVPLALKDVFTTTDMPTTCGSKILEGWTLAVRRDGHRAAARGRHPDPRQDEHGRVRDGSSTENSAYGPTRNPWNVDRVPGGSGGGSAAALAAFQAPLAIGIGHRRLDPPAGRADRDGRGEAHLRHGVAVRPDRVRVVAGPGRTVRAHGARHRAAARGDRRARPEGLDVGRGARCPTSSPRPEQVPPAT